MINNLINLNLNRNLNLNLPSFLPPFLKKTFSTIQTLNRAVLQFLQCFFVSSVSRNTVPNVVFPNTLPREQGVYWSQEILSSDIAPVARE